MSYQVLARKYRPQRFGDVVGQEHVTQTLAQAIAQKRIAHAYLFCGPRGTGKTTIARIFAKCLNCTGGPKPDFDEADPKCVEITEGRAIDVLEIDGASNNGVDQVRELRETAKYAPATSPYKIYIIDEVHMLTTAAFNALLKTLEEPPAHVKFLFATTDPEKVLPTILSRCQRFDLRRIPVTLIVKQLARIAQAEKVTVEAAALHAIARGCDGGMRDAESALDQLISFCGSTIVESDVLSMYGLTAQAQLLALSNAILDGDAAVALRELDSLAKAGKDLGRLLADLLRYFRNLMIFQVAKGDLNLLEASEAEAAALAQQATQTTPEAVTRIMEVLSGCELNLRDAASRKILIELALLKSIQARHAVSLDTVLKHLQQLRADSPGAPAVAPASSAPPAARGSLRAMMDAQVAQNQPPPAAPAASLAAPAPAAPAPNLSANATFDGARLEELWSQLIEASARAGIILRTALQKAHPVSFAANIFTVGFAPSAVGEISLMENPKTQTTLQNLMRDLGFSATLFKFFLVEPPPGRTAVAPAPAPAATPPPVTATPAAEPGAPAAEAKARPKTKAGTLELNDFKNDPLIAKALELFKGTIAEARV